MRHSHPQGSSTVARPHLFERAHMDKRFKPLTLPEQLAMRRQAIQDVAAHPEWSLSETIHHIRTSLRLTVPEFAQLTKVSARTIKDLEAGRTSGTVQTVESLLAVVGLRLGVQSQSKLQIEAPAGYSGTT